MFRPKRGAYDERSPYGNFWFEPTGLRSLSGMRVSGDAAMRLGAVYRCVDVLAKTFAVLPFGLYQPSEDGSRGKLQRKHWLYRLLAKRPNRFQNPFEWRQMCMGHVALRGNAYNRIYSNMRGEVTDLIPQHPDRVTTESLSNGDYRYRIKQSRGEDIVLPRGQMWHMRGLSSDGITGISPLAFARDAIGTGLAAQEYGALYFKNAGAPTGGWIELPGKFGTQADREQFKEEWQGARTGEGRHKTPVLESGMKFHEIGIKNDEAQFLETRKFSVTDICRFFGVPPHLAYDLDRSTNNNIEQQSLEFVVYTMTPVAESWEASIEYEFLMDEDGLDPEFDMQRLLRADQKSRGEFYKTMFNLGAYSPNDIRIREGDDPVAGGEQRFVPVNMTVLKPNMQPSTANKLPAPDPDAGDGAADDDNTPADGGGAGGPKPVRGRLVLVAMAAAERVARREAAVIQRAYKAGPDALFAAYAAHAKFVAEALGVELAAASEYCERRRAAIRGDDDLSDFETVARCQLERLALYGTECEEAR
jgi:HK97 family phage portal protein